jgi:hypothetical protein
MLRLGILMVATSCALVAVSTRLAGQVPSTQQPTIQSLAIIDVLREARRAHGKLNVKGLVESQSLDERFTAESHALNAIAAIVGNVNQVLGFAKIEGALGAAANPWSDDGFRNAFDRIESYVTSAGLLAAAVSAFLPADKQKKRLSDSH